MFRLALETLIGGCFQGPSNLNLPLKYIMEERTHEHARTRERMMANFFFLLLLQKMFIVKLEALNDGCFQGPSIYNLPLKYQTAETTHAQELEKVKEGSFFSFTHEKM